MIVVFASENYYILPTKDDLKHDSEQNWAQIYA